VDLRKLISGDSYREGVLSGKHPEGKNEDSIEFTRLNERIDKLAEELRSMRDTNSRHDKVQRADDLLLFTTAFFGILFSLFQSFIGGSESVLYFLPVLLMCVLMPTWVGYWRGAMILNSNLERVRGWKYLFSGLLACVAYEVGIMLVMQCSLWGLGLWVTLPVLLVWMVICALVQWRFANILFYLASVLDVELTRPTLFLLVKTSDSALDIAAGAVSLALLLKFMMPAILPSISQGTIPWDLVLMLVILLPFILYFLVHGIKSELAIQREQTQPRP